MSKRVAGVISLAVALTLVTCTGAYAQDDEGDTTNIDNSINDSGNVSAEGQYQNQNCSVVINQYNNAVAGDANADGESAAAQVAAETNTSINVVQNCIQAGGDIVIEEQIGSDDDDNDTGSRESEVLAGTYPVQVLANTGGVSPLLPAGAALVGAGLLGFGMLRRR